MQKCPKFEQQAAITPKRYEIGCHYIFQPIAVETLGPINGSAVSFLSGLGRRIADV